MMHFNSENDLLSLDQTLRFTSRGHYIQEERSGAILAF